MTWVSSRSGSMSISVLTSDSRRALGLCIWGPFVRIGFGPIVRATAKRYIPRPGDPRDGVRRARDVPPVARGDDGSRPPTRRERRAMTNEHARGTSPERTRRRSTDDITSLIDWALGDVTVDPAVDDELTRAARVMRLGDYQAMRRRAA